MAKLNDWLKGEKVSKKVSDILPKTEILAQLAEEASELAQAALKLRRALDGTNPAPKSVEECRKAFEEEYADVMVCMAALGFRMTEKRMSELELLQAKILPLAPLPSRQGAVR